MEPENIILSEVSQAQKAKNHVLPHMWTLDQYYCNYFAVILLDMGHMLRREHIQEE
jgi:hypothetical protein